MGNRLESDYFLAVEKSIDIKDATKQLKEISIVGAGETNHGINNRSCNFYSSISNLLNAYCSAGEKDAERVKTVADHLEQLDHEMSNHTF